MQRVATGRELSVGRDRWARSVGHSDLWDIGSSVLVLHGERSILVIRVNTSNEQTEIDLYDMRSKKSLSITNSVEEEKKKRDWERQHPFDGRGRTMSIEVE